VLGYWGGGIGKGAGVVRPQLGEYVALTPGFDLALVEEPDGLLVKLLLGTGVLATREAFVLIVVAGPLLHHEIAANHQSRSPDKRHLPLA
jgi:hypothetical protein